VAGVSERRPRLSNALKGMPARPLAFFVSLARLNLSLKNNKGRPLQDRDALRDCAVTTTGAGISLTWSDLAGDATMHGWLTFDAPRAASGMRRVSLAGKPPPSSSRLAANASVTMACLTHCIVTCRSGWNVPAADTWRRLSG